MSDTSAFIAGCATTGAAALMLLLARISMGESPTQVNPPLLPPGLEESVMPVPAPPPPTTADGNSPEQRFLDNLDDQQALIDRLESQLTQQDLLIRDLESQLRDQREQTTAIAARLESYERSVDILTTQQQQMAGMQQTTDKTQSSLLWVGAGLVLVVLVGGALVLVILVILVAFQSRHKSNSRPSQIVYSAEVPSPHPGYYPQTEFLPPAKRPRRIYQQEFYDYD